MGARLPVERDTLAELCKGHRIRKSSLSGSEVTGTARSDSDIDLPVEFDPGADVTLLDVACIEIAQSGLLGGRKVDLRTAEDLSRHFRDSFEPQRCRMSPDEAVSCDDAFVCSEVHR